MNIPAFAEQMRIIRSAEADESGRWAVVTDSRLPYCNSYVYQSGDRVVCRTRWEYPLPDAKGRIFGLRPADVAAVKGKRTVEAGIIQLPNDLDEAVRAMRLWLDRLTVQLPPHRMRQRESSANVAESWNNILGDLLSGPDDETTENDRLVVVNALATEVGPTLLAAILLDELNCEAEKKTRFAASVSKPDPAILSRLEQTAAHADPDRKRMKVVLRELSRLVARVPDRGVSRLRISRDEHTRPLKAVALRLR